MLYDILTDHDVVILVFYLRRIGQRALADDECDIFAFRQDTVKPLHCLSGLFVSRILADNEAVDPHIIEKLNCHFSLIDMLRLVVDAGFSSPSDDKDYRDGINLVVKERCDRIDDVSFAAVLHINDGDLACCKVISCGKSRAVSFVRGDHMVVRIDPVAVHEEVA